MDLSEIIRCRFVFHGRVQGVGFRYVSQFAANEYGATGWVRNEYVYRMRLPKSSPMRFFVWS